MDIPQEVAPFLTRLQSEIRALLADNLVGLYLRGSLVTGGFRPETSDLDLLAVTARLVDEAEAARLLAWHAAVRHWDDPFATRFEIAYVDQANWRRFEPGHRFLTLGQGEELRWTEHQSNWILERWMVREQGVALFGPPPQEVTDPVARAQLAVTVSDRLQDWVEWASHIDDPEWHWPRSHKAYVVETMCRALYTLACGEIGSKQHSVAWAQANLPEPWRDLVVRSQTWRTDSTRDDTLIVPVRDFVFWSASQKTNGLPCSA